MATYYKRDTNPTNNNWNQNDNWSTVSSTSATNTGTFPVNGDTVIFDANSIQVTINVASACTSINFTGYTNTITMTNGLTVAGNVTLDSGMTISGAGNLTISATSTYDSNGKTFPNTLRLSGTITVTLAENATVQNLATVSAGTTSTLNSNNIYVLGNISITGFLAGTTTINAETTAATTGTWSWATSGSIANNFKINPSGTFVISGNVYYQTGTLEYVAGTVTVTGSTIFFNGNSTLKSNGFTWNNFQAGAISTITLSDNCTCANILSGGLNFNNNNIYVTGGITTPASSIGGTATLHLIGTGTWVGNGTYGITCPLTINTTGTITMTGTCVFAGGTFTYTAGTINAGTSTLEIYAGTTYNIASGGMTIWNYTPRISGTHTINTGNIIVNNNMTITGTVTFAGTAGWTVNNWTYSVANTTINLKDGVTYTITGTLSLTGTNAQPIVITSSSATLRAILTLNQGANQTVQFVRATRIDSGAGQTIWDTVGTIVTPLTDTINWNSGSRPAPFNSIRMG